MVELGSPFSQPYQDLIASLEQSLREGVEQPVTERIIFQSSVTSYDLRYPAVTILRVSGLVGGGTLRSSNPTCTSGWPTTASCGCTRRRNPWTAGGWRWSTRTGNGRRG